MTSGTGIGGDMSQGPQPSFGRGRPPDVSEETIKPGSEGNVPIVGGIIVGGAGGAIPWSVPPVGAEGGTIKPEQLRDISAKLDELLTRWPQPVTVPGLQRVTVMCPSCQFYAGEIVGPDVNPVLLADIFVRVLTHMATCRQTGTVVRELRTTWERPNLG